MDSKMKKYISKIEELFGKKVYTVQFSTTRGTEEWTEVESDMELTDAIVLANETISENELITCIDVRAGSNKYMALRVFWDLEADVPRTLMLQ